MGNPSPRRDAENVASKKAGELGVQFSIEHRRGTGGWWHAVAVDPSTGDVLRESHNGQEILAAYRPVVGDR